MRALPESYASDLALPDHRLSKCFSAFPEVQEAKSCSEPVPEPLRSRPDVAHLLLDLLSFSVRLGVKSTFSMAALAASLTDQESAFLRSGHGALACCT